MSLIDRIKQVSDKEGLTISKFERIIGASAGLLRKAIKNGTDVQSKWISKIAENFPQYNYYWLLTGEGNMHKEKDSLENKDNIGNFGDDGIQMNVSGGKNKVHMDGSAELQKFKSENKIFAKRIQELESDNKLLREQNSKLTNTVLELAKGKNI